MNYWYLEGADGRRYSYAGEPSWRCPLSTIEEEEPLLWPVVTALAAAGADAVKILRRVHSGTGGHRQRDPETGRLTDRCGRCGAKMKRLGFAIWTERKPTKKERQTVSARLNTHLGFSGYVHDGPTRYVRTKKEASAWASEKVALSQR